MIECVEAVVGSCRGVMLITSILESSFIPFSLSSTSLSRRDVKLLRDAGGRRTDADFTAMRSLGRVGGLVLNSKHVSHADQSLRSCNEGCACSFGLYQWIGYVNTIFKVTKDINLPQCCSDDHYTSTVHPVHFLENHPIQIAVDTAHIPSIRSESHNRKNAPRPAYPGTSDIPPTISNPQSRSSAA